MASKWLIVFREIQWVKSVYSDHYPRTPKLHHDLSRYQRLVIPTSNLIATLPSHAQNPILLRFCPALSPECSAFAFFALAISRSNIPCVTFQCSGFGSVLPA